MSNNINGKLPAVYLARHGETTWSLSGQHTGLTDLPLTERGELNARQLGDRLRGFRFGTVLTSPLQRAQRTCELAGFGEVAEVDGNLVEWDYGAYEGLRRPEILGIRPNWQIFQDGCPDGETPAQVAARADQVIQRVRAIKEDVLIFSSGHFLRMLTARWLGLEPLAGSLFVLNTASMSILSYEHELSRPVMLLWDDTSHLENEPTQKSKL